MLMYNKVDLYVSLTAKMASLSVSTVATAKV